MAAKVQLFLIKKHIKLTNMQKILKFYIYKMGQAFPCMLFREISTVLSNFRLLKKTNSETCFNYFLQVL